MNKEVGINMSNDSHWPDGTPKSAGNAFTAHGYQPGLPAADVTPRDTKRGPKEPLLQACRAPNAFGAPDGVIPGMGDRAPRLRSPSNYRTTA